MVEDPKDIVVCGLMIREFGEGADASVYGETASKVISFFQNTFQFFMTETFLLFYR